MVAAILLAVAVMLLAARPLGHFIDNNPTIKMLALAFIVLIGAYLLVDGLGLHMPKGYIYGAMGFSAAEIGRAHAELQSLMRISYAVFCLKKQKTTRTSTNDINHYKT